MKTQSIRFTVLPIVLMAAVGWLLVQVIAQPHSIERHGAEAASIQDCLRRRGPVAIWQALQSPRKLYYACQLPDGRWGLQILFRVGFGKLIERTAFVPGHGTLEELLEYLARRATPIH